jgi:tetratricopeptide (TPR) repeat protein
LENKDFLNAMKLSFILFKNGSQVIYKNEMPLSIIMYTKDLIDNKKYEDAIKIFNWYLSNIGIDKNILDMKAKTINLYVIDWKDYNELDILKKYLDKELNLYPIDSNRKYEIYKNCYLKAIDIYNKENKYELLFKTIYDFTKIETTKNLNDSQRMFNMSISSFYTISVKNDIVSTTATEAIFNNLLSLFPQWSKKTDEYKKRYYQSIVQKLANDKKYPEAFSEIEKIEKIYSSNDSKIKELKTDLYISYTAYLYEKWDYKNTILYCDKALKEFPNNATIINNYKVFLNHFIVKFNEDKEYSIVRYVLNKALDEFPEEKNFKTIRNELKFK